LGILGDVASWVPLGVAWAFGVTLQFVLALSTRGFWTTRRELNLARRRMQAPRLLGCGF